MQMYCVRITNSQRCRKTDSSQKCFHEQWLKCTVFTDAADLSKCAIAIRTMFGIHVCVHTCTLVHSFVRAAGCVLVAGLSSRAFGQHTRITRSGTHIQRSQNRQASARIRAGRNIKRPRTLRFCWRLSTEQVLGTKCSSSGIFLERRIQRCIF